MTLRDVLLLSLDALRKEGARFTASAAWFTAAVDRMETDLVALAEALTEATDPGTRAAIIHAIEQTVPARKDLILAAALAEAGIEARDVLDAVISVIGHVVVQLAKGAVA